MVSKLQAAFDRKLSKNSGTLLLFLSQTSLSKTALLLLFPTANLQQTHNPQRRNRPFDHIYILLLALLQGNFSPYFLCNGEMGSGAVFPLPLAASMPGWGPQPPPLCPGSTNSREGPCFLKYVSRPSSVKRGLLEFGSKNIALCRSRL